MILGLGSDITDARRIAKVIERHGDRFLTRVFTDIERAKAERRKNRAGPFAKLPRHLARPENALRYPRHPGRSASRRGLDEGPPFRNNTLKTWMKVNLGVTRATAARLIAPDRPSRYKAAGRLPGTRGR